MSRLIVKHKVKDFDRWKFMFDKSDAIRRIYGEIAYQIFRNTEDPNDVTVLFEWESSKKVLKYAQTKELQAAMRLSGVEEDPEIYVLDGELDP